MHTDKSVLSDEKISMSSDRQAEAIDELSQTESHRSETMNHVPSGMPAQAVTSSPASPSHSLLSRFETPMSNETPVIDPGAEDASRTVTAGHGEKEPLSHAPSDSQLIMEPYKPTEIISNGSRISLSMQKILSPPESLVNGISTL